MYSRIKLQTLNLIEFENALELFLREATFKNQSIIDTNVCINWAESDFGKLWEDIYRKDQASPRIKNNNEKYIISPYTFLHAKILKQ